MYTDLSMNNRRSDEEHLCNLNAVFGIWRKGGDDLVPHNGNLDTLTIDLFVILPSQALTGRCCKIDMDRPPQGDRADRFLETKFAQQNKQVSLHTMPGNGKFAQGLRLAESSVVIRH